MSGPSSEIRRPPPALKKNLSRRVSFNESTIKPRGRPPPSEFDMESQISSPSSFSGSGRCRGCCPCGSCCSWFSIVVAIVLILALLLGGIYFAFLQANLPEVRLHRLDVGNATFKGKTLVAGEFEARLNATNLNSRIELRYIGLTASMSSEGMEFVEVRLPDLRQQPHAEADIRVRSVVRRPVVEEVADLAEHAGKGTLVINVVVKGHIDYYYGGKQINGFPFKIDCHNIDQMEIDDGHAPRCNTILSPIS